ncbi:hypothetical protein FB451DRAFT_1215181 [Mycena latifolia]|nr:hypothetical protein FB451DRAFT_1215181 [Mycena latifolia]
MSCSGSQPIPTALADPIIEGYAQGIRQDLAFILIATVFGSLLIPLLILLFALSTPQTRRKPIFILNVISVALGMSCAVLTGHLAIESILSPFARVNVTENIGYVVLAQLIPWFAEAVLLVRIAIVFSRRSLPLLLAFPITIKGARAAAAVIFCVKWAKLVLGGHASQTELPRWIFRVQYFLEFFDNSYVSFLFLWRLRLANHSRFVEGTAVGRVSFSNSTQSYASRLQTLFWIAATNFVFPLIFGLIQIVTAYAAANTTLYLTVSMVNHSATIISTVFATVWSSTSSFKEAVAQNNQAQSGSLVFHVGQTMDTVPPSGTIEPLSSGDNSMTVKEKKEGPV